MAEHLALAASDEVWMLENAIYSISVTGRICKYPLERQQESTKKQHKCMKLTADDLKKMGVIECALEEPEQYTVQTMKPVADQLRGKVEAFIENYEQMPGTKTDRTQISAFP